MCRHLAREHSQHQFCARRLLTNAEADGRSSELRELRPRSCVTRPRRIADVSATQQTGDALSRIRAQLAPMPDYRFTDYFESTVLRKRPYLRREWCIAVVANPVRIARQDHNRFRFWARVPQLGDRYLRVVTLEDQTTIHNAFPERGFKP